MNIGRAVACHQTIQPEPQPRSSGKRRSSQRGKKSLPNFKANHKESEAPSLKKRKLTLPTPSGGSQNASASLNVCREFTYKATEIEEIKKEYKNLKTYIDHNGYTIRPLDSLVKYLNNNFKWQQSDWPEMKCSHDTWNEHLARYALYVWGIIEIKELSLESIRLLDSESEEYFQTVGRYGSELKVKITNWNNLPSRKSVEIPANGIFRHSQSEWTLAHKNIFHLLFSPLKLEDVKFSYIPILKILNPDTEFYELVFYKFMCLEMNVSYGQELDFREKSTITKRNVLAKKLNEHNISLPPCLRRVTGTHGNMRKKDTVWGQVEIIEYFKKQKGISVIEKIDKTLSLKSDFYSINALSEAEDEKYNEELFDLCRKYDFNFSRIITSVKGGLKVNGEKIKGIKYRPIDGVEYDKNCYDANMLTLAYIHRFGINCQEVYTQLDAQCLYKMYRKIKHKEYKGTQIHPDDLFALASGVNENHTLQAAIRSNRAYLSEALKQFDEKQLKSHLRQRAERLHKTYRTLLPFSDQKHSDTVNPAQSELAPEDDSSSSGICKHILRSASPPPLETYKGVSIGHGIKVDDSLLLPQGKGLIADRKFQKGEVITWFEGRKVDLNEYEALLNEDPSIFTYSLGVTENFTLVGEQTPREGIGGGSFVNDVAPYNTEFIRKHSVMALLVATRDIEPGEEFRLNYGSAFWECFEKMFPDIKRVT
ncbi:hypothetical protein NX722_15765 [Endozoicomonas gorgoniicola]|uniref:SET domain-containing protein n=1 Tax=Endozoicomonas gorgoniicola TaxID=1234144 RepID=A0ABT3MXF6_9GAMM|nr:SET domain-containing protein-lysine N-methyltransferase [Endozoicomonas gorgoniicola]MCW7554049.1 hypothetical protein [Endozoicomonas gorgoniicola]